MGRIVMGQVQFTFQAPAGTIIDFSYTEDPLRPPRGGFGGMHSGTRYYARGADDCFSVYDALGFRYANLLVHGIRWAGYPRRFRCAGGYLPLAAGRGVQVLG